MVNGQTFPQNAIQHDANSAVKIGAKTKIAAVRFKLVKIIHKVAESKPKAYTKYQRERWKHIS